MNTHPRLLKELAESLVITILRDTCGVKWGHKSWAPQRGWQHGAGGSSVWAESSGSGGAEEGGVPGKRGWHVQERTGALFREQDGRSVWLMEE